MRDVAVIDAIRHHAIPADVESAAQRLEGIPPLVSIVLSGEEGDGSC